MVHGSLCKCSTAAKTQMGQLPAFTRAGQRNIATEMKYPMFAIPVPELVLLDRLRPHQELLTEDKLFSIDEETVIFISHEWLGWSHPDPDNVQFSYLKKLLNELKSGRIAKIESDWRQVISYKENIVVKGAQWQAALSEMYIWFDYLSVPQPTVAGDCVESVDSDHRFNKTTLATDLAKAVESLPSYVERSAFVMILAPPAMHNDGQKVCNFNSWRRRGWCRLEAICAILCSHPVIVMVCKGQEPRFLAPYEFYHLRPGSGDFTCCARNHVMNAQVVPCDRLQVEMVLSALIYTHLEKLKQDRRMLEFRYLLTKSQWLIESSGDEHKVATLRQDVDVDELRDALMWDVQGIDGADEYGYTLLHWAISANSTAAVKQLLDEGTCPNMRIKRDIPHLSLWRGSSELHIAMSISHEEIIFALLARRADPNSMTTGSISGVTPFMMAAIFGNGANVQAWLRYFPNWDVNTKDATLGFTALHWSHAHPNTEVLSELLTHQADINKPADNGPSALICMASGDDCNMKVMASLLHARADVNYREVPQTFTWKSIIGLARCLYHARIADPMMKELATIEKSTALHHAARGGLVDTMEMLIDHRADANLKNRLGLTSLALARDAFNGEAPMMLVHALEGYRRFSLRANARDDHLATERKTHLL